MTIHLPIDLENSIRAEVARGHFASLDDAMTEAARLLLRQQEAQADAAGPLTEDEFQRKLLKSGFVTSLPTPADPADRPPFQPVMLEGEPLSETIIRERR